MPAVRKGKHNFTVLVISVFNYSYSSAYILVKKSEQNNSTSKNDTGKDN